MSRHQHAQSAVPPAPPLNIEEMKFWLRIMEEHAIFIRAGLSCDQCDLIEEAKTFQQDFKNFRIRLEKTQSEKKLGELISQICRSLKEYIRYKRLLLCLSLTGKLEGSLYPLFFDHIIREAEYFMALLAKIRGKTLQVIKVLEADFWLRIMSDHTHLVRHLLDPSERGMIKAVEVYMEEFDDLSAQARAFSSMLNCQTTHFSVFDRFLKDSRAAAMRLRDFNKVLHDMICCNNLLSIIPSLLADHMRRETEHFILVLAMMEKEVMKSCKYDEASAAKYYQSDFSLMVDDRELEKYSGDEENRINKENASDFNNTFLPQTKFKGKSVGAEPKEYSSEYKKTMGEDLLTSSWQKKSGVTKREDFEECEEDKKKEDEYEDDRDYEDEKEMLFSPGKEPAANLQSTVVFPGQKSTLTQALTQSHSKDSSQGEVVPKCPEPASSSQTKTPKYKIGLKWPRQLGKISS